MELWQGSELDRERWERWQRWREELMAERQWQERKQRSRERWQGRNQNVLDVRHDGTHCSLVQERRKHKPVRHR